MKWSSRDFWNLARAPVAPLFTWHTRRSEFSQAVPWPLRSATGTWIMSYATYRRSLVGQMAEELHRGGPRVDTESRTKRLAQLLEELRAREGPDRWPQDFDPETWLAEWIRRPQPALDGRTPAELLEDEDGFRSVRRVFGAMWSGAYQ
ncbi:MbcA/ParS/Xre antitoxin family protein [Alterluteimonas muca]|uniref:MbcA/ParS/Xre antitoxin family protein n=1 Tax=Alterluteimonas muca TaxID=2878684 RepID=UPI003F4A15D8